MTYMPNRKELLYRLQDSVLLSLQAVVDPQWSLAKLCGGTALSRFWLDHRVSYDLDFFLPHGFKAASLAIAIKTAGLKFETTDLVDDPRKANQLHGYLRYQKQTLKLSFVEDAYFDLFPVVIKLLGGASIRTESVQGLYHRKLRTVAGGASDSDSFEGGRQKARDLFDLYVLSQMHLPLQAFMDSLPYAFPRAAFANGLANMPWFDLLDELAEIDCDSRWNQAKDVHFLQDALYAQIAAFSLPPIERAEPAVNKRKLAGG